ncbi:hypothetical protein DI392_16675 [Vibrio albus]|uniref:Methyl-accepting chemotaxis protein n=1 Tax=Vibrio albus TaxID=2200953 RepID=A0A2U3B6G0_9VIBR|nr:methyl-accepting chemotaxis protein [Vibrio albus]PWI32305.1 hypothetical protein DI392_16675 [Vibrio albus]
MFKDLKLGVKISAGFALILALLSIVITISMLALNDSDKGVTLYRSLSQHTNLLGKVQANMLMVRMNMKDYLITQDKEDLKLFSSYLSTMKSELQDVRTKVENKEQKLLLSDIHSSIEAYDNAFHSVIKLIDQQNNIHDNQLVPSGGLMYKTINDIISSTYQSDSNDIIYQATFVREKMLHGRLFVVKFLQSNKESDFKIALNNINSELGKEIKALNEKINDNDLQDLLDQFKQANKHYIQGMHDFYNITKERNHIVTDTLDVIGPKIAEEVESVKLSMMKEQNAIGSELKSKTNNSVHLTLGLSVIAILMGIGAAYLLTIYITKPIHKAVGLANQLAQGDLTINVGTTSKDETGLLLGAIQNTATNLKQMVTTISKASIELATASEELATVTEQTSQGIAKQEQETDMVATAMTEMTTTVHDVAGNASSAADAANQADQKALAGTETVDLAISLITSLSENVNHSSEKLNEVQREVINIGSILDVIRDISEQTNLLALNAAIEAARAGEQGRGFAVVADEVRNLAARTHNSTSEIQNIIEVLNVSTQSTVEVMDQGKNQANECVEQASNVSAALQAIAESITVINDMNMQIASASEQQSTVAEDINQNIVNVKNIAEENTVASDQTRSSSYEIARLADDLNQLVVQFRV